MSRGLGDVYKRQVVETGIDANVTKPSGETIIARTFTVSRADLTEAPAAEIAQPADGVHARVVMVDIADLTRETVVCFEARRRRNAKLCAVRHAASEIDGHEVTSIIGRLCTISIGLTRCGANSIEAEVVKAR